MNICLVFRQDFRLDGPVECYARSVYEALEEREHEVTVVGEGHDIPDLLAVDQYDYDLLLEIENGRNSKGELFFQQGKYKWEIPSAVWLIDSHGQPDTHQSISGDYNHVFFAVWNKRDLYTGHPSAHWSPCATDLKWFNGEDYEYDGVHDFGFFGSKGGLPRADKMKEICVDHGWTYDIRQVSKPRKHKWPMWAVAMSHCRVLFNHGQKHDGPRVAESMAMRRPLITDLDPLSGMEKVFINGEHFLGYEAYTHEGLEEMMTWAKEHPKLAAVIASNGYEAVKECHQVSNRVDQILEVVNVR